ncbi:MAG: hypothetical protein AB7S75_01510 [Desulfococcaceae bacterium]
MEVRKMNRNFSMLDIAEFGLIPDVVKKENPEKHKRVELFLSENGGLFFLKDRYPHGLGRNDNPELVKRYFVSEEIQETKTKIVTFIIQKISDKIVKLFSSDDIYYIMQPAEVLNVSMSSEKKEKSSALLKKEKIGSDGVDISGDRPIKIQSPDGKNLGELHWDQRYIVGENLDSSVKLIIKMPDGKEEVISPSGNYFEIEYHF